MNTKTRSIYKDIVEYKFLKLQTNRTWNLSKLKNIGYAVKDRFVLWCVNLVKGSYIGLDCLKNLSSGLKKS